MGSLRMSRTPSSSIFPPTPPTRPASRRLFGMRWWLGLAFAFVAGLTALAVVAVLGNRSEVAFRTYAQEFAVGNTVASSETLKRVGPPNRLPDDTAAIAARRRLSLFV